MALSIENRQRVVKIDRRAVRRLVALILREHDRGDDDLTIVFCDDDIIADLNATYRDVDRPTDVLAFPMSAETGRDDPAAPKRAGDGGPDAGGPEVVLGDVVISVERAAVQARRYKRTLEREILKLVAHGVLHLLGNDHETTRERTAMRNLENRYLKALSGDSS